MTRPAQPMSPAGPVIPPPPARIARRRKGPSARWLIWPAALGAGVACGAAAYHWASAVAFYFDHWLALLG